MRRGAELRVEGRGELQRLALFFGALFGGTRPREPEGLNPRSSQSHTSRQLEPVEPMDR